MVVGGRDGTAITQLNLLFNYIVACRQPHGTARPWAHFHAVAPDIIHGTPRVADPRPPQRLGVRFLPLRGVASERADWRV